MYHHFVESKKEFKAGCAPTVVHLQTFDNQFKANDVFEHGKRNTWYLWRDNRVIKTAWQNAGAKLEIESVLRRECNRTFYHLHIEFPDMESKLAFELAVDVERFYNCWRKYPT